MKSIRHAKYFFVLMSDTMKIKSLSECKILLPPLTFNLTRKSNKRLLYLTGHFLCCTFCHDYLMFMLLNTFLKACNPKVFTILCFQYFNSYFRYY